MERQLDDQRGTDSLLTEQRNKMEQLITSHDQEMAVLTEKLRSSEVTAANLQLQVQLLQEQVESQTSVHQSQIRDLKSSLSMLRSELQEKQQTYEAKVGGLEEQLTQAHLQEKQAQTERDLSLHQAEELEAQLCRLMEELRQTTEELSVERKQMQQLWERDTGLSLTIQGLRHELEQRSLGVQQLESHVQSLKEQCQRHEDTKEQSTQEAKQLQAALDEREKECDFQQQEAQQVRMQLEGAQDRVQTLWTETEVLRMKLQDGERSSELMRKSLETLKEERCGLAKQLEQFMIDNQQLKVKHNAPAVGWDLGLKVALGMQKQITAKREQIDFLQSRIQMLEETTEKLAQEKRYQAMESKRCVEELRFEMESRRRLETELDTVRTNEKILKSKAERLDTALHKMSDSFAECQEYIQRQEQEIMRLKLQHALELKELQGQNLRSAGNIHRSPIASPTVPDQLPTLQTNSTSQTKSHLNTGKQRPSPTLELQSLVKELQSVINDGQRRHARTRSEETYKTRKPLPWKANGKCRHPLPSLHSLPFSALLLFGDFAMKNQDREQLGLATDLHLVCQHWDGDLQSPPS
ncbi:hypothetical protein NFI96_008118 [Prochilodus magdalenae]|nr:hypothetical protein NFI96_008118 [Prochilodus magdalenae]